MSHVNELYCEKGRPGDARQIAGTAFQKIAYAKKEGNVVIAQGPQGQQIYKFLEVTVPDQGKWVSVVQKDMPPLSSMPGNANFTPFRLLVNMAVVDYNNLNSVITSFDPPIELELNYTNQDLAQAALFGRELKLAYWDGKTWEVFTYAVNQFTLVPSATGGVAHLMISSWAGDPPMAWGR